MSHLPWVVRATAWTLIAVPRSDTRSALGTAAADSYGGPRGVLAWLQVDDRASVLEATVVAVVALLVLALLLERRQRRLVERSLQQRLEFETLVSELSSSVSILAPGEMSALVTRWLQRLARCLGVDRVSLLPAPALVTPWVNGSAAFTTEFPALSELVARGEVVRFASLEVLPTTLARDRQAFQRNGVESALLLPLRHNGTVLGTLAFNASTKRTWPHSLVERLQFVAAILTRAVVHRETKAEPAAAIAQAVGEASRPENETARFARMRTLGEFALSLAHELNQPLAAILSNAQAARRFLAVPNPPIDEVRAIIEDIDADDRRAGEVIHGMRALLHHHDVELVLLDLNDIVRDVVRLLHGDFLIRRVALVLDLEAPLPAVRGDVVQIQQVLLNLMLNAFEAMQGPGTVDRRMIVRTRSGADGCCVVSVRDAGCGIPPNDLDRVFEQFFSTKLDGLGMGLSIGRSIVEGLGGRIWATNNSDVGATFHFALPVVRGKEET